MKKEQQFWDNLSSKYNGMFRTYKPYQSIYRFIKKSVNREMEVLEVGTGTGLIAREIAGNVKSVQATDFSDKMIAKAKNIEHSSNIYFSCANIFDLPFDANSFDVVVASNILHIIPEPEKAMKEIFRVLKPQGVLFAPTFLWQELSLLGRIQKFIMMKKNFPINTQWNEQEYKNFINTNGFVITQSEKIKASFPICCIKAKREK